MPSLDASNITWFGKISAEVSGEPEINLAQGTQTTTQDAKSQQNWTRGHHVYVMSAHNHLAEINPARVRDIRSIGAFSFNKTFVASPACYQAPFLPLCFQPIPPRTAMDFIQYFVKTSLVTGQVLCEQSVFGFDSNPIGLLWEAWVSEVVSFISLFYLFFVNLSYRI